MKAIFYFLKLAIVAIFLFGLSACGTDDPVSSGNTNLNVGEFLPTAVGMLWTYEVYDSLISDYDTVQVSVVEDCSMIGGAIIYKVSYKSTTDIYSRYFSFFDSSIAIYTDSAMQNPMERFESPFATGEFWTGPYNYDDTSRITDSGDFVVTAGYFEDGFRVDRVWNRDFEGGGNHSTTWLIPDVGMVYFYKLSQYSDGAHLYTTVNETWELIDYDLMTFSIDQFPNDIGFFWRYEIQDSVHMVIDTLFVMVAGTATITTPHGETISKVWVYDYGSYYDTEYVVIYDGNIEIYHNPFPVVPEAVMYKEFWYEFPLAVGRYWGIEFFIPIPDVVGKEDILYRYIDEYSAFHHTYSVDGFNYGKHVESWMVPNIGVMYRTIWEYNLGPIVIQSHHLIDYGYLED